MSVSFTIFCHTFLSYSVVLLEFLNANIADKKDETFTYHISKFSKWLSCVKPFSTFHASQITAMKILVYYIVRSFAAFIFLATGVLYKQRTEAFMLSSSSLVISFCNLYFFIAIFRCLMKQHMDMRSPWYFFCPVSTIFNVRTTEWMEIYLPGLLCTSWTKLPLEATRNVTNMDNADLSLLFSPTLPVWKNIKRTHSQLIGLVCSLAKYYH